MRKYFFILILATLCLSAYTAVQATSPSHHVETDSIIKIEMHLSAYGVESEDFPSIDVTIDFL